MQIRIATADDAALLHDVAAETFPLACPPHTTRESIDAFIAQNLSEESFARYLSDPERQLFVAVEDGRAVGYTMVVYGEPSDTDVAAAVTSRPTAELSKVYVRSHHHGGGIARALVEESVAAAADRGAVSVWLGVNQENERANAFYEKSGFRRVGVKKFLVGQRYEDDFVRELLVGGVSTGSTRDDAPSR